MVSQEHEYAIETFGLTKIFPDWWGRPKVIAVDALDLKIRHNEVYGLLGPNGSGKTTTLKMLLSLLYPSKGNALMLGRPVGDAKVKEKIGYLPEESFLYRFLNAQEILDFYGRIFGLPAKVRSSRIEALLDMVGLAGMANRPIGTYSKGMARRIGLAQALINDPQLLILDEPTSGMDPIGTRQMKDLIKRLAERGKTILLCSHLLADVEDVCDRIGILYGGKMQVEGRVDTLLQHSDQRQILTGRLSEDAVETIRTIVKAESDRCEVSCPMDRLEDYFINIVTQAQAQQKPTSGAVSKSDVGEFLSEMDKTESILDKLVTRKIEPGKKAADTGTVQTEKPAAPAEPAKSRADRDLLRNLTQKDLKTAGDAETDKPRQTQPAPAPAQPEPPRRDDDLLNKLAGRGKNEGSTERTHPSSEGDASNA